MWGDSTKSKSEKVDTLVGQNTELRGDVIFSGGLHVDGKVKGNIIANSETSTIMVLSENGTIEGEVKVPYMIINGTVIGDLHAEDCVELGGGARITGNVYYNKIEMSMGAEVNGNLVHIEDAAKPVISFEEERNNRKEASNS